MRILLVAVVAAAAAAYWGLGWPGASAFIRRLFQPSIVLGLVPLAFLLGAIRLALLRAIRALLKASVRPSA